MVDFDGYGARRVVARQQYVVPVGVEALLRIGCLETDGEAGQRIGIMWYAQHHRLAEFRS